MKRKIIVLAAITCIYACVCKADFVINDILSQSGGIDEGSPAASSTQLNYRVCNSTNSDQQALLKIDIIGNNPANQVPAGSTITLAQLRLRAQVGGDGVLYRCAQVWDSTPTWNEEGDVSTVGPYIAVGLNTEQQLPFDVTSHVQAWADGTSNQGWVIKGFLNDCQAARIYNGSASSGDRPQLLVTFVPPDTTGPRITDIDVGSTVSVHADYDVPVGSGQQIRTIPVAKINRIFVKFDENVAGVNASAFELKSAITGNTYALAVGGVTYSSSTFVATFTLANPITNPDKLTLTIKDSVTDLAGNQLDGEWLNPTSINSTGTDTFATGGNGVAGGNFVFRMVVLAADFTGDNIVNSADLAVWDQNYGTGGGPSQSLGNADGDSDVDGDDFLIWQTQSGTNYTNW